MRFETLRHALYGKRFVIDLLRICLLSCFFVNSCKQEIRVEV
jgi:hypothetical protein